MRVDPLVRKHVINLLRRGWSRSTQRTAALCKARVARGRYRCNGCKSDFKRADVQVDHIKEIGVFKDFDRFIARLFCPPEKLQVLCKPCHHAKTHAWMKGGKK